MAETYIVDLSHTPATFLSQVADDGNGPKKLLLPEPVTGSGDKCETFATPVARLKCHPHLNRDQTKYVGFTFSSYLLDFLLAMCESTPISARENGYWEAIEEGVAGSDTIRVGWKSCILTSCV